MVERALGLSRRFSGLALFFYLMTEYLYQEGFPIFNMEPPLCCLEPETKLHPSASSLYPDTIPERRNENYVVFGLFAAGKEQPTEALQLCFVKVVWKAGGGNLKYTRLCGQLQ